MKIINNYAKVFNLKQNIKVNNKMMKVNRQMTCINI